MPGAWRTQRIGQARTAGRAREWPNLRSRVATYRPRQRPTANRLEMRLALASLGLDRWAAVRFDIFRGGNAGDLQAAVCVAWLVPAGRSRQRDLRTDRGALFQRRRMLCAARRSTWSRCPHAMQQRICLAFAAPGIKEAPASLRGVGRNDGHHPTARFVPVVGNPRAHADRSGRFHRKRPLETAAFRRQSAPRNHQQVPIAAKKPSEKIAIRLARNRLGSRANVP